MAVSGKEAVVPTEHEINTHEMSFQGKYAGTDQDDRDMRVLGKRQVLNVS